MFKRITSSRDEADSDLEPIAPTSRPTIGNTHVGCRLFSSHRKSMDFHYKATIVSQLFICLYMITKVYAFAVIVYVMLPVIIVNAFYILFISPIRLFKLSLITSIPKSLRSVFTTSKKSSCNSSCRSIIKPVSK